MSEVLVEDARAASKPIKTLLPPLVITLPASFPIIVLLIPTVKALPASIPKTVFPWGAPDSDPGTKPEYKESVSIKKGY